MNVNSITKNPRTSVIGAVIGAVSAWAYFTGHDPNTSTQAVLGLLATLGFLTTSDGTNAAAPAAPPAVQDGK
jgi:hypothetical protein